MRIVPVVLSLGLAACGMSQEAHQRALDEQQRQLTAASATEKAALQQQLADAQAKLAAAEGASGTQVTALQKQVKALTAALRTREAQLAWIAKDTVGAERLVKQAYDAAKAAGGAGAAQLSEAYDLVKQKKPAAEAKLQEAAAALSAGAI